MPVVLVAEPLRPELSDLADGGPVVVVVVGVVLLHYVEQPLPGEVLDATGHER